MSILQRSLPFIALFIVLVLVLSPQIPMSVLAVRVSNLTNVLTDRLDCSAAQLRSCVTPPPTAVQPPSSTPPSRVQQLPPAIPATGLAHRNKTVSAECDELGECSVEALVHLHAEQNTVVVTFGNSRQRHFTENWVYHLQLVGVGGLLVGMMNARSTDPTYRAFALKLRAQGVGVYTVNSPEVSIQPQGGRWFHVLPLIRTGVRVLLSDSDVVWLRDPRPYLERLELTHPLIDFTVSSDQQQPTDNKLLRLPRRTKRRQRASEADILAERAADLDVEAYRACGESMNIGMMHFPPGARAGSVEAMVQAVTHLSQENNLRRVDQGPINFRWKHGAGDWRWKHQMHPIRKRLCALVNDSVVGAVLPSAQFCNTLTYSVLKLWEPLHVRPFAVHATWMRQQVRWWWLV